MIEDQADTREGYAVYLRYSGFNVVAVANGAEAIQRLDHVTPDVIVLDVGLPDVDGLELLKQIKGRKPLARIPVVVVTGRDLRHTPAGAKIVLRKPVLPQSLLAALLRFTSRRGF